MSREVQAQDPTLKTPQAKMAILLGQVRHHAKDLDLLSEQAGVQTRDLQPIPAFSFFLSLLCLTPSPQFLVIF